MTTQTNDDQREFWSDQAGPKWVVLQEAMDAKMRPILDGVIARADLQMGQSVLDIGSGTGDSVLRASDIVGPSGHVTGADISETMIDLARSRTSGRNNVAMVLADAAEHSFEPQSIDRVISRFGVMFFANSVAAFANIAKAMKPGATLTMACWGQIPANPFFTLAAGAARTVVGQMPKSDPDGPGPFAFREPQRVLDILAEAGFSEAACEIAQVSLTPQGNSAEVAEILCQIGPAEAALTYFNVEQPKRDMLRDALIEALSAYEIEGIVRIPSEINYFTARC